MPQPIFLAVLVLFALPSARVTAQRSGTTSLVVRVVPESRLDPQQVPLHFRVSADGGSDATTQSATVAAWVRARPGQQIRLTASLANLQGPDGSAPASAVRWRGSSVSATGGGRQAACTSGSFTAGGPQDLVQGWGSSGILNCALSFELTAISALPPGLYSGVVTLALAAQ